MKFFIFSEEKNLYLAEQCNRMSKAISKCDELSENLHQLSSLAKEQRDNMQLLKIKCKEMVDNIERSKCLRIFFFAPQFFTQWLHLNSHKFRNRSVTFLLNKNQFKF